MNILNIFPTAGFDRSTTTPVLIGVLISWLLTESFGWVFAGLVVPGYLAAVFVLDPRAGMVDVGEAILTYGLARMLGEHLARTGLTSRVFGRERFLLVVIASVLVRLAVEGAILPRFAPHAAGSFFSIGLVVVPLAANACWKTGLARGLVQNGIPTLLVFLLLRFVLVPHTNLSLAGFELATEDIAASFLGSPKAYILLLTGAVLAAASNVLDGWDFNGILVPALLALVVIEPFKFFATFAEALLLVAFVAVLLKTTPLGRANIEGPRRIVLYFAVDYALRFAFAGIAGRQLAGGDIIGLMGFGYLLPTLLAVKIAQKGNAALVILPTAQVSISAFLLGTLIGFCASVIDTDTKVARAEVSRAMPQAPGEPIEAALWAGALALDAPRTQKNALPSSPKDVVALVDELISGGELSRARALNLEAQRLDGGVLMLRERFEQLAARVGDPTILVTTAGRAAPRRIVALITTPVTAPETAALAAKLLQNGDLDAVVIAGVEPKDGDSDDAFVRAARGDARALADRGGEGGVVVTLLRASEDVGSATIGAGARKLPRIDALLSALGDKTSSITTIARDEGEPSAGVDVAITLPTSAIARLFDDRPIEVSLASPTAMAAALEGLHEARTSTSFEDLLALRRLVLQPLLAPPAMPRSFPLIRLAAASLGYELRGPGALAGGGEGVALVPKRGGRPIAAIVRTTGVAHAVLEAPQGYGESIRDAALRLGSELRVDAILLGLEPGGSARGGEAMRVAHALSTFDNEARDPKIVLLREGPAEWDNAGVVSLGAWGGASRDALEADVKRALQAIGLSSTDAPIDLAARELSGRSVFGDVPLVSIVADGTALRLVSLDEARTSMRVLTGTGLTIEDGAPIDVAEKLAAKLPTTGPLTPEAEILRLAGDVAVSGSVVARRALATAIEQTSTRAAIARSVDGDYLVVVARAPKGVLVAVSGDDPQRAQPLKTTIAPTLRGCAAAIVHGGACRAEAP